MAEDKHTDAQAWAHQPPVRIVVSPEAYARILEICENPPRANARLREAMQRYGGDRG